MDDRSDVKGMARQLVLIAKQNAEKESGREKTATKNLIVVFSLLVCFGDVERRIGARRAPGKFKREWWIVCVLATLVFRRGAPFRDSAVAIGDSLCVRVNNFISSRVLANQTAPIRRSPH